MAQALHTSLATGGLTQGGLRPGLGGDNIFATSALDLNFGMTKSLGGLVTFTRASSGTYVGSDGVLKTATTNLLLRSEEFDNGWTLGSVSVTANAFTAPNGTNTADQLIEVATTANHEAGQSFTPVANTAYTLSCYFRAAGSTTCGLRFSIGLNGTGIICSIDLTAKTATVTSGVGTASITEIGAGWFRVSLTATASATPSSTFVYAFRALGTAGSTGNSIYIWGAQLEQSSTVGEYIPTTSTINSAPRFDHNPTTGESLGLLVEEQRTNSIRNNTMVGAVAGTPGTLPTNWVVGGGGLGTLSQQVVGIGSIGSLSYIDVRYSGTTSTTGFIFAFEPATQVAALTAQSWASSFYVALVGGSLTNINQLRHDLVERTSAGGAVLQNFSGDFKSTLTSNLARSTYTVTLSGGATTAFVQPSIEFGFASGVAIDITLRIGLPQLEQGAFATSVIPTTGTAATRSADVASITGTNFSSWYRVDEGSLFTDCSINYTVPGTAFPLGASLSDGTTNNRIENGFLTASLAGLEVVAGGVTQAAMYPNAGSTLTRRLTTSFRLNDFAVSVNGGTVNTDTSGTVPTVDRLRIGERTVGYTLNGTIRRLVYWGQRLPNNVLQTITQ